MSNEMPQIDNALAFQDILPHIATLYRRSLLVPFIGSGMSRPACTSWEEFLEKLAVEAGVEVPKPLSAQGDGKERRVEPPILSRLADETVSALRPLKNDDRSDEISKRAFIVGPRPSSRAYSAEQGARGKLLAAGSDDQL